eukprot:6771212-Ditylum_brightwellii.AAC.1
MGQGLRAGRNRVGVGGGSWCSPDNLFWGQQPPDWQKSGSAKILLHAPFAYAPSAFSKVAMSDTVS